MTVMLTPVPPLAEIGIPFVLVLIVLTGAILWYRWPPQDPEN
tara:strand:+ start:156 stop:281 length:126 start_codon:yes stop_codon:yes gene_type:complete